MGKCYATVVGPQGASFTAAAAAAAPRLVKRACLNAKQNSPLIHHACQFFDDKYGLNLTRLPSNSVRVATVGAACALVSFSVLPSLASWAGPGASQFFFFYLFVCCLPFALADWVVSGKSSATDHGKCARPLLSSRNARDACAGILNICELTLPRPQLATLAAPLSAW